MLSVVYTDKGIMDKNRNNRFSEKHKPPFPPKVGNFFIGIDSFVQVAELTNSNVYVGPTSNLPHFMRIFLNFTYYLLLSPFRVIFNKQLCQNKIHTYPPHTIICAILHFIHWVYSVLLIRGSLTSKIVDNPTLIFHVADSISWCLYTFLWSYIFWFKKKHVLNLFKIPERPLQTKVKILGVLLCLLAIVVPCYEIIENYFDSNLSMNNMNIWFAEYTSNNLFVWLATDISNLSLVQVEDLSPGLYVFGIFNQILDFAREVYLHCFETLGFILAISTYQLVLESQSVFFPKNVKPKFKVLILHYGDVLEVLRKVNHIGKFIILAIFIQIMSWISESWAVVLDEDKWTYISTLIYFYIFYTMLFGMAAETQFQMKQFKVVLLENLYRDYIDNNSYENVAAFLRESVKICGLKGGKFFLLTYDFLGAVIAVMITYAAVMLQLEGSE